MRSYRYTLSAVLILVLFGGACEQKDEEDTFVDDNIGTADLVRGGVLYDKWWKESGTEPTTDHPLWSSQSSNTRSGSDTWRCKECHGWDYKGKDGAYGSGSHFTGFPGIYDSRGLEPAHVFDDIGAGTDHNFEDDLTDADILDLTKFVTGGLINMGLYIDSDTKLANGDAGNGQTLYENTTSSGGQCINCHGADGTTINFGSEEDPEYLGGLALGNPWETLHKIRFGHPGSVMPSTVKNGLTDADAVDILTYSQTLPTDVPATSLVSASVSTAPTLDGIGDDAVWSSADEFDVTVGQAGYAIAFGEFDVQLKSVHTATDVYILASWDDPSVTESVDKNLWTYDSGWSKSGNEDRIFFMFDAGDNGTEGADCATMCHVAEGSMYTTGGGHVDVWHWKSHRTNPIGLVDDKWWDGSGRGSDTKTISAYSDNVTPSGNFPLYAGPVTDGHFIIIAEGGSTDDLTPFDSTDVSLQANNYPGYYLNANAASSGESRHDVMVSGKYDGGRWTVEFKRALDTGHDDDVVFAVGSTTEFSLAVTDNSGGSHSGAGVFDFTIE